MYTPRNNIYALLLVFLLPVTVSAQAAPAVVTSIKPLHILATELMSGVGEPVLLLDANSDPHHYSMRLSERRQLADADILLWVGPELEQPLAGLVSQLDADIITASELVLPRLIDHDPHLWLDTANVIAIAEVVASRLENSDPANNVRYEDNLDAFTASLLSADAMIADLFSNNTAAFAVYHDAYSYFEQRYGLAHTISLTGHEDVSPGVRQIQRFRSLAEEEHIGCILTEPGVDQKRLGNLLETDGLKMVSIDPVWHGISANTGYAEYLTGIATSIAACLDGDPE